MQNNLGFIPSWQFNRDPAQNPNLTPFMQMPPGMYQTTRQPVGPYMTGSHIFGNGFGETPVSASMAPEAAAAAPTMPMTPADEFLDFVNQMSSTWWWRNRRAVGIGVAIALGLGVVGGISAIMR